MPAYLLHTVFLMHFSRKYYLLKNYLWIQDSRFKILYFYHQIGYIVNTTILSFISRHFLFFGLKLVIAFTKTKENFVCLGRTIRKVIRAGGNGKKSCKGGCQKKKFCRVNCTAFGLANCTRLMGTLAEIMASSRFLDPQSPGFLYN